MPSVRPSPGSSSGSAERSDRVPSGRQSGRSVAAQGETRRLGRPRSVAIGDPDHFVAHGRDLPGEPGCARSAVRTVDHGRWTGPPAGRSVRHRVDHLSTSRGSGVRAQGQMDRRRVAGRAGPSGPQRRTRPSPGMGSGGGATGASGLHAGCGLARGVGRCARPRRRHAARPTPVDFASPERRNPPAVSEELRCHRVPELGSCDEPLSQLSSCPTSTRTLWCAPRECVPEVLFEDRENLADRALTRPGGRG